MGTSSSSTPPLNTESRSMGLVPSRSFHPTVAPSTSRLAEVPFISHWLLSPPSLPGESPPLARSRPETETSGPDDLGQERSGIWFIHPTNPSIRPRVSAEAICLSGLRQTWDGEKKVRRKGRQVVQHNLLEYHTSFWLSC
ncbi:hypothetical protein RRG08_000916 [Elysia crispata]|uniref:Uncharacterized protein n=1 Tax=Elysia crispata TaxID=231223 RepID=A0AAE1AYQ4_9GAST|nr:hypothetical protein RRG08_000916 [Elysia crispata]